MAELVNVTPGNYDINLFDIDPSSVQERSFTDPGGKKQTYFNGTLTYNGHLPYFTVEGDTYGISKGNGDEKKAEESKTPEIQGMTILPGVNSEAKSTKRDKWQIPVRLSSNPAPKDWTPQEKLLIDFINDDIRDILAHVLSNRVEILSKIGSNVINDAQQQFSAEMQESPDKYPDEASKMNRFKAIIRNLAKSKISRKVYRKKKARKEGEEVNFMDASSQYDESKHPTLYTGIMSFISKKTETEEFITKYYQWEDGVAEIDWKELTHAEAVSKGWYRMEVANRFDNIYFGASVAPQIKAAEVVLKTPIENKMGHKGRLIHAAGEIKKNPRLISRTAITSGSAPPVSGNTGSLEPPQQVVGGQTIVPVNSLKGKEEMTSQQSSAPVTMQFDPSALNTVQALQHAVITPPNEQ